MLPRVLSAAGDLTQDFLPLHATEKTEKSPFREGRGHFPIWNTQAANYLRCQMEIDRAFSPDLAPRTAPNQFDPRSVPSCIACVDCCTALIREASSPSPLSLTLAKSCPIFHLAEALHARSRRVSRRAGFLGLQPGRNGSSVSAGTRILLRPGGIPLLPAGPQPDDSPAS
jgi:hypothetical protein